jgi:hypothetical protein
VGRLRSRKLSGSSSTAKKRRQWLDRTKSITAKLREVLGNEENARWFNIRAPATFPTVEGVSKAGEPTAQAGEVDTAAAELRDEEEGISYERLLAALDGLHKEVSRQLSGRPLNVFQLSRSPFEYLAGELMPEIFFKHFKRKIGISRAADNGRPQGPLFRFVRAGVDLLNITHNGKPYADEASRRTSCLIKTSRTVASNFPVNGSRT